MEWHKRLTPYQMSAFKPAIRQGETEAEFLQRLHAAVPVRDPTNSLGGIALWSLAGKPYYKMWPAITEGLARMRLDLPVKAIMPLLAKLPEALSVRLPVGHELKCGPLRIREMLAVRMLATHGGLLVPAFAVQADTGEVDQATGISLCNCLLFHFTKESVEDSIKDLPSRNKTLCQQDSETCELAVRVVIGLAMIHDNPDMVEAVVLRKDQAKYAETRDPKYVERAKRRGEYGFNVGANVEVLPHFRRPHFAIRWTGKGGEVPKLVPVTGCVVKRSRFTEVPTGYQADEELASTAT